MLIALGANLPSLAGPPGTTLTQSIAALAAGGLSVNAVSRFFSTPAFPPGSGPDFVNAALLGSTDLTPDALLALMHATEAAFSRVRHQRWAARTLDLDLIAVGDLVLPDRATYARWRNAAAASQQRAAPDRLILPHPRLQDRSFVLVPLADVAPDWRHPVLGRNVAEMLAALPEAERGTVVPI